MNNCVDIIVTYNRKELLKENINALINQTYKNHDIMIINNASTDGTEEYVKSLNDKRIIYYNTGSNLGGAGGFSYGLEQALKIGYEYAWIMDDDSIPQKEALESVVNKAYILQNNFSFISSLIYWTDNNLCIMNMPKINYKNAFEAKLDLIKKNKIMPIESGSFVGCFINLAVAKKIGLPISEFFIYGDDIEYTLRLKKNMPAYLDLDSIIVHKTKTNEGADIVTASEDRIDRYYYQSRNGMYIARKNHTIIRRLKTVIKRFILIIRQSKTKKMKRIYVLIKGSIKGFFFNPKIRFVNEYTSKKVMKGK